MLLDLVQKCKVCAFFRALNVHFFGTRTQDVKICAKISIVLRYRLYLKKKNASEIMRIHKNMIVWSSIFEAER